MGKRPSLYMYSFSRAVHRVPGNAAERPNEASTNELARSPQFVPRLPLHPNEQHQSEIAMVCRLLHEREGSTRMRHGRAILPGLFLLFKKTHCVSHASHIVCFCFAVRADSTTTGTAVRQSRRVLPLEGPCVGQLRCPRRESHPGQKVERDRALGSIRLLFSSTVTYFIILYHL